MKIFWSPPNFHSFWGFWLECSIRFSSKSNLHAGSSHRKVFRNYVFWNLLSKSFISTCEKVHFIVNLQISRLQLCWKWTCTQYFDHILTWPLLGRAIFWNSLFLGTPAVAICCIPSLKPFLYVLIEEKTI